MAKPKSTNASKKLVENLVQVTDKNRKICVVIGRKMLVYDTKGKAFTKLGEFEIRPRLEKGNFMANGVKLCYVHEDEDRQVYVDSFKSVIDWLIKKNQLYIDTSLKLINYE